MSEPRNGAVRHKSPTHYSDAVSAYGSQRKAAAALGVHLSAVQAGVSRERKRLTDVTGEKADGYEGFRLPTFPGKHPSTPDLIKRLASDMRRKQRRAHAERWFRIHLQDAKPIGIMWFGDPHLGVLCDWDRLQRDVAVCTSTPGMYGANIGDVADNWTGSLMRIASEQDISRRSERQLARWFLTEAGITWLVWLFGNHDEWNDGAEVMRLMDIHHKVPMFDWSAKFELRAPGAKPVRIHAAHDFPGHSMWNATHGPARTPRMLGDRADLYVAGHKHTWGIQQYEMPEADLSPLAVRVRGYKRGDPHARRLGYPEDRFGCSILTIIDPSAAGPGRIMAFPDVEQGAKVLRAMRGDIGIPTSRRKRRGRKAKA